MKQPNETSEDRLDLLRADIDVDEPAPLESDEQSAEVSSSEDVTDQTTTVDSADAKGDRSESTCPRWQKLAAAALAAVVVVMGGVTAYTWVHVASEKRTAQREAEAVETAKALVLDLTTLNHNGLESSVNKILSQTTGGFRNQFADSSTAFETALTQGQVDSVGRIDSAGLSSGGDDKAVVLVAASSTVKNSQAPQGDPRVYRIKVTLDRIDDRWLVSNMEFVS